MIVRVRCPAKINPFLSVGPRDARGYHPIRTVLQAISLSDTLLVSRSDGEDRIVCDWPGLPAENTLTKSLRLVRELLPVPPLRIELLKSIPAESGLGGGSSDAAGLLRAIGALSPLRPDAFFRDVAAAVGADCPFFLLGGRAKAEGYGEILEPLAELPEAWLVVARPNEGCATGAAYARLDEERRELRPFPADGQLRNDFESVAPRASMELAAALRSLGASRTLLCGSGSAVFGEFPDEATAREVSATLLSRGA